MRILETELLAAASSASPGAMRLLSDASGDDRRAMAESVATAFEKITSETDVASERIELPGSGQFDSVLYGSRTGGTVVAYSFSGLGSDLAVPLFSAAVAFFTKTLGPGVAGSAANGAVALWKNLAVLREPADSDAIAVLRAAIEVRTRSRRYTSEHLPSTAEIVQCSLLGEARALAALRGLSSRRILAVRYWGDQNGDEAAPDNVWSFVI